MKISISFNASRALSVAGVRKYWITLQTTRVEFWLTAALLLTLLCAQVLEGNKAHSAILVFGGLILLVWILNYILYRKLVNREIMSSEVSAQKEIFWLITDDSLRRKVGEEIVEFSWGKLQMVLHNQEVVVLVWGKYDFSVLPAAKFDTGTLGELIKMRSEPARQP